MQDADTCEFRLHVEKFWSIDYVSFAILTEKGVFRRYSLRVYCRESLFHKFNGEDRRIRFWVNMCKS